jgi:hypothetical protein
VKVSDSTLTVRYDRRDRDDPIYMGPGRDLSELQGGRLAIHAGAGADQIEVDAADARVYGGLGADFLSADMGIVGSRDVAPCLG